MLCQIFPVAYVRRKLLDRERRYSVMERECLGIVWGIKKIAMYLYDMVKRLLSNLIIAPYSS